MTYDIATLLTLLSATRDYMQVLQAGLAALTDETIEDRPDLVFPRDQMRAALQPDPANPLSFSTPAAIMHTLVHLPDFMQEPEQLG